ncbi:MAG: endonuclease domain-containing protein [Xanthobacteraceae bacterium]
MRSASPSPARGEGKRRAPIIATKSDARRLRRALTDAERKLWRALRARQFQQVKFRRQVPVGPYVADFLCYQARLVIELDGSQHAESHRDKVRDRWFARNGFRVLRFWNNDVLTNLDGLLTTILSTLAENTSNPSPLAGESGEQRERRCEPGEGAGRALGERQEPPPASLRSAPSPARGGGLGRGCSASRSPASGEGNGGPR